MNLKRIFTVALATGLLTFGASTIFAASGAETYNAAWNGAADTVDDATYSATTQEPAAVKEIVTTAFQSANRSQYPGIVVAAIRGLKKVDMDDCDLIRDLVEHAIELAAAEPNLKGGKNVMADDMTAAIINAAMEEAPKCRGALNPLAEAYLGMSMDDDDGTGWDPFDPTNVIPPGNLGTNPDVSADDPRVLRDRLPQEEEGERPRRRPIVIVVPEAS